MRSIPVTPMAKPRMNASDKWKKRPVVLRYRAYKDELRPYDIELPELCKVVFHMPMPPSWSQKKRDAMLDTPHKSKPDIDNLAKGLLDALFEDDAHVWSLWTEKRWCNEGKITISQIKQ